MGDRETDRDTEQNRQRQRDMYRHRVGQTEAERQAQA